MVMVCPSSGESLYEQDNHDRATYADASSYGNGLTLGGDTDWKLPDVNELQSIVWYEIDSTSWNNTHIALHSAFTFNLPAGKNLTETRPHRHRTATAWVPSSDRVQAMEITGLTRPTFASAPAGPIEMNSNGYYDWHGPGAQRSAPGVAPDPWVTSIGDQKNLVQVYIFVR